MDFPTRRPPPRPLRSRQPSAGRRRPPPRPGRRATPQSQIRHPNLDVGRPRARRHPRSQTSRRLRLLRSLRQAHPHQRNRNRDQRATPLARAPGRQVFHHPQYDARSLRSRNRVLHGPDWAPAGRTPALSLRWRRGLAAPGLQRRILRIDSSLHRAHPTPGPVFRERVSRSAIAPSPPEAIRRRLASPSRAWWRRASPTSGRRIGASCSTT
jgi:hypothetical protein